MTQSESECSTLRYHPVQARSRFAILVRDSTRGDTDSLACFIRVHDLEKRTHPVIQVLEHPGASNMVIHPFLVSRVNMFGLRLVADLYG